LRLQCPKNTRGFQIWDTPSPPSLEDCEIHGRVSSSLQLKTVDLCGVSGLTFFFAFSKLYAVHAHTPARPYATSTFERLSRRRQLDVSWAYLPMPRGEEIYSIVIRLKVTSNGQISTLQKPWFLVSLYLLAILTTNGVRFGRNWLATSPSACFIRGRTKISFSVNQAPNCSYIVLPMLVQQRYLEHILEKSRNARYPLHFPTLGPLAQHSFPTCIVTRHLWTMSAA